MISPLAKDLDLAIGLEREGFAASVIGNHENAAAYYAKAAAFYRDLGDYGGLGRAVHQHGRLSGLQIEYPDGSKVRPA